MVKLAVVSLALAAAVGFVGCSSDDDFVVPQGTVFTVARTDQANAQDTCSGDVIAGLTSINQTLTLGNPETCGGNTVLFTTLFSSLSGDANCTGNDSLTLDDLESDGGTGTDVVAITCDDGTSCTEAFNTTLSP